MKKILIPLAISSLFFVSCKTSQVQSYQDDVYVNPAEEKKLAKIIFGFENLESWPQKWTVFRKKSKFREENTLKGKC